MLWYLVCFCVLLIGTDFVYGKPVKHNHGITVHKILSTWDEANDHCRREGGVLASPIDGKILNAMKFLISVDKMYHIGTRAGHSPGTYLSIEGVPLENMTEAMDNMIQELDPLTGDCMAMDQNSIRFIPCWTRLQYLCYNTTSHSTRNIDCNIDDCCGDKDYKYQSLSHKCYKVSSYLSWDEAFNTCNTEGGRLAVVGNENDKQSVLNMNVLQHDYLYLGLRDRSGTGDWKSIDGRRVEDLFNVWNTATKPVDPDNTCAVMGKAGVLIRSSCSASWAYICEKEPDM